ncbi:SRPBCC domain-containing protein [Flavobacterium piscinae]|uniref:SRPBCC domain-containing protein n=1 Tax=Flavobacterium piscinae TaxID=2506424 RepID=A0A4Q1KTY3_9FLAO|nr:SRPBCC domain-containing protein [Flavobacterium piscinae]MBC8883709.1 SRPBCC domain-containing protein [Flavobacterium piscinae]RXR33567.1 SRPBCC domain-containing protein [Flavobacterium piscinae]
MKKLTYSIAINAKAEKVFSTMIAKATYQQWTAAFNPTSTFEGGWNKGEKIHFIGTDENGKKGGMVSRIAENIPNQFISIHHLGILDGDKEILDGPEVEGWGDALENYSFSENNGVTTVTVEMDTKEDYADYFDGTWPKALAILKELCED